jgi:hypothetical protein
MLKIINKVELSRILNRYNNINIYLYPYKYNFKNNIFYILENFYYLYIKKLK